MISFVSGLRRGTYIVRKIDFNTSLVLLRDRRNKNAWSPEILVLNRERVCVSWIEEVQRVDQRCPAYGLLVESSVNIVEHPVTSADCILRCLRYQGPAIELLEDLPCRSVVTIKR